MLYACGLVGVKPSTACGVSETVKVLVTVVAVSQLASPACVAVIVTSPAPL